MLLFHREERGKRRFFYDRWFLPALGMKMGVDTGPKGRYWVDPPVRAGQPINH
jgi:hypothetical protein